METRDTFVVTLFRDPGRSTELRGRVRHVTSSREATFRNLQELSKLLKISPDDAHLVHDNFISESGGK